ncbi:uncharacterized protein LOC132937005 [Metopolophium dirhodum]|nr:uncharacterized protein LOC132935166 [Metopolophium dirhodum]XP_060857618.1 uncharacterized protein LOC132935166 [Metopolophium dirhodum]XP_060857619.1 uncharacterized protein LOC132935166 [Metopolophium dirhodum]XP_060859814.1 uncharacterized protein LOC132937005 [Metopolophium dirhodum]XP_060859815.1 uncharacterized protein LOC132937005 [Metopolophium dirhodum]XP_060859816.1 uncharacterized protein LOC132937005 [Metopolophium dirhodum]XP_060859817.1 uncharacterized protein LOC132937005 [
MSSSVKEMLECDPKRKISNSNVTSFASKGAKKFKLDKPDKDNSILFDRTVCVVPANIPLERNFPRNFQYPTIESGQTVYAMQLTIKGSCYDPNSKYDDEFYAGIAAEPPNMLNNFRYLIFFYDSKVQYRQHQGIRLIARWRSIHVV